MRTNGTVVAYNVDSLVQYILATGDFSEPQTRLPFSDGDLKRIDAEVCCVLSLARVCAGPCFTQIASCCQARKADLPHKSVWEAKQNKHEFEAQKVKRDGILGTICI